jgi:Uma2 family endonuclease
VDNLDQPLLAEALREALGLAGLITHAMQIATNFGLCATVEGKLVIKAPDWVLVNSATPLPAGQSRRSYTPHLEGELPALVMEFLSESDGGEYSARPVYPYGKWFFYEQILQVPHYAIFDPALGTLELYRLDEGRYHVEQPNEHGRYWIAALDLFVGVWQGEHYNRTGYWLRWWDRAGQLLPWGLERLEQERQRIEQEQHRAEQERQRAEQERQRAERERQAKEAAQRQAAELEQELARLREQLDRQR